MTHPLRRSTDRLPDGTLPEVEEDTTVEGLAQAILAEVRGLRREVSNSDSQGNVVDASSIERWHGATRGDLMVEISRSQGELARQRERREYLDQRTEMLDTLLDDVAAAIDETRAVANDPVFVTNALNDLLAVIERRRLQIGGIL